MRNFWTFGLMPMPNLVSNQYLVVFRNEKTIVLDSAIASLAGFHNETHE